MEAWSSQWKGREAELQHIPGENMEGLREAGLGTNLIDAIATAQSWLVSQGKLERLLTLSVTATQRQHVTMMLDDWRTQPKPITFVPVGEGQFQIAHYQIKSFDAAVEKLKQFPTGSQFIWNGDSSSESGRRALTALKKAMQKSGIAIDLAQSR